MRTPSPLRRLLCTFVLLSGSALFPGTAAAAVDPDRLAGLRARSIGPAVTSGRIADVQISPGDPEVIYAGAASGGVWRSRDGGLTWTPIFDDQPVASVGSIALHAGNPDLVWVGTGESKPRNSVSVGNGVYRSRDGGKTWSHLGLEKSERISRVLLHPRHPEVAWVAALGQAWGENPERGVFKTADGGKTWRKVLYVDERTGAADLAIDPSNPDKLYASMWDYRRWPWSFRSGGRGSGLFVSHDGGESWKRLTPEDGLPEGNLGRIGLAVAPSDPRIVYALVEAEKNVLLRSEDGGASWKTVNSETQASERPFYFSRIRVDPADPNRIYRLTTLIDLSEDGGRTFRTLVPFNAAHPDHHAMSIDPKNPSYLVAGNDGGVYISRNRGESWRFAGNLPVSQFYHVRVDQETPYNVYGGLQDNGSWRGPSAIWEEGGIRNHHWQELYFGDGFDTAPDPEDATRGYAMSQQGYLARWNLKTGERKDVRPAPERPETRLRFNWNAGFALDPFDPATIYLGSQFVHKSADRGETWTVISPDLTTNRAEWQKQKESGGLTLDATGAENFTTILAIAPSPKERGLLWVGTDDGRIQVTRDGGQSWQSVEGNLRGVPANTWIPHVTPSPHDAATAFVVLDNHRRADWTPYVYKTADFGKTWKSLATADLRGYALSIVQDPVDPELLFLGTEFGLWTSLDGGRSWLPFRHGVPTSSVMDLVIHPRDHDLVLATHGRSFYVLDDIRPLRSVSEKTLEEKLHLYESAPALVHAVGRPASSRFPGQGEFEGENRPYGAILTYSLHFPGLALPDPEKERERKEKERAAKALEAEKALPAAEKEEAAKDAKDPQDEGKKDEKEVEIQISDAAGQVLRNLKGPANLGINRAVWDLSRDAFKSPPRGEEEEGPRGGGPEVLPGTYTVTVKFRGAEAKGTVAVVADPRTRVSDADRQANFDAQMRAGRLQETAAAAIERIRQTRDDLGRLTGRWEKDAEEAKRVRKDAPEDPERKARQAEAKKIQERLTRIEKKLWQSPDTKGIVADDDALSAIGYAGYSIASSKEKPTAAQLTALQEGERRLQGALTELNELFAQEIAAFRAKVAADLQLLPELPPLAVEK